MRKWHPDTVEDAATKQQYTLHCAEINVAHDDAVRIAEIRERIRRADPFQGKDIGAELRRGTPRHSIRSAGVFKLASPIVGLLFAVYFLSFRISFPVTIMFIVFAAGAFLAAIMDWLAYRYAVKPALRFLGFENHPFFPWAILELVNLAVVGLIVPDSLLLFQAGLILALPVWRAWRWTRGTSRKAAYVA
jgi:hypothetical protein